MAKQTPHALIVYQGTYPWEVRIEKFARVLSSLGFECTLLCRWGGEADEVIDLPGLHVRRLGYRQPTWQSLPTSLNPLWRRAIRRAVDELQPSIVVAREMLIAEACTAAARGRVPVLMDMAEHYPAAMRSWKKYREHAIGRLLVHTLDVPDRVEAQAVRGCDAIVCVCQENIDRVERVYGFDARRMALVMNTPPLHEFDTVRMGCADPARVFSYQGYVTRERGVERCIRAFNDIAPAVPQATLLVAGAGESFSDVQLEHERSAFKDRIELMGAFRHDQLQDINSRTDIGLIAFDQDEFRQHTIPNKLFDYLLCAKPVIVSACAPMARIVNENDCGLVVDVNTPNALSKAMLRMSTEDCRHWSDNARKAAIERYHWEQDALRLKDCFVSLL